MKRLVILLGFWAAVISVLYVGVVKADVVESPKRQVMPPHERVYHYPQPRGNLLKDGYKSPGNPVTNQYLYTPKPAGTAYRW